MTDALDVLAARALGAPGAVRPAIRPLFDEAGGFAAPVVEDEENLPPRAGEEPRRAAREDEPAAARPAARAEAGAPEQPARRREAEPVAVHDGARLARDRPAAGPAGTAPAEKEAERVAVEAAAAVAEREPLVAAPRGSTAAAGTLRHESPVSGPETPETPEAAQRVPVLVPVTVERAAPAPAPPEVVAPAEPPVADTTVHVTIGRIDVRAVAAPPPAERPRREPPRPTVGVEEYLGTRR